MTLCFMEKFDRNANSHVVDFILVLMNREGEERKKLGSKGKKFKLSVTYSNWLCKRKRSYWPKEGIPALGLKVQLK